MEVRINCKASNQTISTLSYTIPGSLMLNCFRRDSTFVLKKYNIIATHTITQRPIKDVERMTS